MLRLEREGRRILLLALLYAAVLACVIAFW